jgi:hypothetical protein
MLGMTAITPATLGGANGRLCTVLLLDAVAKVAACTNLLQNLSHRQVVCATGGALWLGDTRVSQGEEQETQMQETTFRAAGFTRAPR